MKRKKNYVSASILNTVLLALATCLCHQPWQAQATDDSRASRLSSPDGKFGPVRETVLPAAKSELPEILDLETGRIIPQMPLESFKFRADAIMAWIRSKGLDLSCNVWPSGATCVTYDMSIVAVAGKSWDEITEEELLGNPNLTPKRHSPRRLLVLGVNRPDTYIFRTGEGTLGMLRLVGVSEDRKGVKIRYKLINSSESGAHTARQRTESAG
jgi:hypothetical protein